MGKSHSNCNNIYIYINITMVNGVIIQLVTYNLWFIDSSSL